jgi:hypothetical protein
MGEELIDAPTSGLFIFVHRSLVFGSGECSMGKYQVRSDRRSRIER